MPKRFHLKYQPIPKLDLHGIRHQEVERLVENFIMEYQEKLPIHIITGNSNSMKLIVINILKKHQFRYKDGDYYNRGYIVVLN